MKALIPVIIVLTTALIQIGSVSANILGNGISSITDKEAMTSSITVESPPIKEAVIGLSFKDEVSPTIELLSELRTDQFSHDKPYHYSYLKGLSNGTDIWTVNSEKSIEWENLASDKYQLCFVETAPDADGQCNNESKIPLRIRPLHLLANLTGNFLNGSVKVAMESIGESINKFAFISSSSEKTDADQVLFEISISCWNLTAGSTCSDNANQELAPRKKYEHGGNFLVKVGADGQETNLGLTFIISKLWAKHDIELTSGTFAANYEITVTSG